MRRTLILTAVLCLVTVSASDGFAQRISEDGIQGSGSVVLERPAERMRMQINLLAKSSKDLPDALNKLRGRRTKAEKHLETLGAIKGSAKFGDPHMDDAQDDNQRQMQMMMMQRMRQGQGKKPAKKETAKPVKVSMRMTAEWPLKSTDPAGLLLEATKIQDAIKSADLAGLKESEEPTEEEAEMEEENEDMQMNFGGRNAPKPGEASFIYVTLISDADRKKALADAYRAAQADADELAKAANLQLGGLRSLQSTGAVDTGEDESYQQLYNSGFGRMFRNQVSGREDTPEALGPSPGTLKYRIGVSASFSLTVPGAAVSK